MDHPTLHNGRDKRVPPGSEGHACHARGSGVDYPTRCGAPDKRVPPKERRRTTVVLPVEAKNEAVGTRTRDLRIKSPLLYLLSYSPVSEMFLF